MSGRDDAGFSAFVAARGTSLLRIAHLACDAAEDAEDLLQTSLERAYRNWSRVRDDNDPEPYVRRIIVNTAISRARRRAILRIVPMSTPPEQPSREADIPLRHALMDALRDLPPRQRAVVVLRYWEDLSEAQTAEILGCSTGTVKSQAFKALAKLRPAIGGESPEKVVRNAHA
ncbi:MULTISPECIES: SigE family RNA polymerase sigma factor [unclassified Streptosporangium]|uniref:SigE family RNA polymerase sigma factor n=1 Tax=unclassified Streptosporangium TaxID=2632669 RepID=UPI002E27B83F|nr:MULTISPECIES: SigE family RNA polymerase sigma factor [unclassified Streptosporangium]